MREPGPPLGTVEPLGGKALLKASGERRCLASGVGENEHSGAPRLAIPGDTEREPACLEGGGAEHRADRTSIARRPRAEKRERDVQVLGRNDPASAQARGLPAPDPSDSLRREP